MGGKHNRRRAPLLIAIPNNPPPINNSENKVNVFQAVQKLLLAPAVMFGVYSGPMIQPVHADGAVSAATVTRASALYGPR